MQKSYSRMNRKNEIANLSKRYLGVMALPVTPGESLPLMVTAMVFGKPSSVEPASRRTLMQSARQFLRDLNAQRFQKIRQGSSLMEQSCNQGCGLNWHRERVAKLIGQVTERIRGLAGCIATSLRLGQPSSTGLIGRSLIGTTVLRCDQQRLGQQAV